MRCVRFAFEFFLVLSFVQGDEVALTAALDWELENVEVHQAQYQDKQSLRVRAIKQH